MTPNEVFMIGQVREVKVKKRRIVGCGSEDLARDVERRRALDTVRSPASSLRVLPCAESDKFGIREGREAIRAVFRSIPDFLHFAVHYVTNPIIERRPFGAVRFRSKQPTAWGRGATRNNTFRLDGGLKLKRLKLTSSF